MVEAMSETAGASILCERCSLLSFDDLAIGGRETMDEDGFPRLSLEKACIELRPDYFMDSKNRGDEEPDYMLVQLGWHLEDTLPHLPNLSHTSDLGCMFCSALRRDVKAELAKEAKTYTIYDGPLTLRVYLSLVKRGIEGLLVEGDFNQEEGIMATCQIFYPIEAAPHNCEKWLGTEPARETGYLDPINIDQMSRLLGHCAGTCHPWQPSSFLPTRLIDVGEDSTAVPRLIVSSDIVQPQEAKYAALSYCWGTAEDAKTQFKTVHETLDERCQSLPYEMMTATSRDAVALTRAIDLRYVWIDALCIVQDDLEDWKHESSQMNLVYRHAFVTFCGLSSQSCHESLLNRAPAAKVLFQSTIRPGMNGYYLIRLHTSSGAWKNRERMDELCTWRRRGWTLQEMELSTRLLLFGHLKMHFRCGAFEWSEGEKQISMASGDKIYDQITKIVDGHTPATALYDTWIHVVHAYRHRLLTKEKDRLPAISGLARIIGETLRDQYFAGIWRGDLHRGLCWSSGDDSESRGLLGHLQNIRERDYVAPSWSWASATPSSRSAISFGWHIVPESTVINVKVDTAPEALFGHVSSGILHLRGKVATLPTSVLPYGDQEEWRGEWYHAVPGEDDITLAFDWLTKGEEPGLTNLSIFLLLRYKPEEPNQGPRLRALIVHPTGDPDQYYRVGMLASEGVKGTELIRTWFEGSEEEDICII